MTLSRVAGREWNVMPNRTLERTDASDGVGSGAAIATRCPSFRWAKATVKGYAAVPDFALPVGAQA